MSERVIFKYGRDLNENEINLINENRIKEFGEGTSINILEEESNSLIFLLIVEEIISAFGILKPITINYLNETFNIFGIRSIVAIIKQKGYGKVIVDSMINYGKENDKTCLGFSCKFNSKFYEKIGLTLLPDMINLFQYIDHLTNEIKNDDRTDIYYNECSDKFLTKIKSTNEIVKIPIPYW